MLLSFSVAWHTERQTRLTSPQHLHKPKNKVLRVRITNWHISLPGVIHCRGSTKTEEHSDSPDLLNGFPPFRLCQSKDVSPSPGIWSKTFSCNATALRHFLQRNAVLQIFPASEGASASEETSAGNPGSAPSLELSILSPRL